LLNGVPFAHPKNGFLGREPEHMLAMITSLRRPLFDEISKIAAEIPQREDATNAAAPPIRPGETLLRYAL